jgi:hypothetical protein
VVLLGEALTAPKLAGAFLVLAGAALAQVRFGKASRGEAIPSGSPSRPR